MKIFIDEKTGTLYRHFNSTDEIAFTPLTLSGVVDLNDGGIVTEWQDAEDEARIREALADDKY